MMYVGVCDCDVTTVPRVIPRSVQNGVEGIPVWPLHRGGIVALREGSADHGVGSQARVWPRGSLVRSCR